MKSWIVHTEPEAHNRELGTNKNRVAPIYQIHAQKLAQIDGKASKAEPGGGGGGGSGSYFHTYQQQVCFKRFNVLFSWTEAAGCRTTI